MTTSHDPRLDLVLEREVDVPVAAVWAGWTRPELIVQWWTPAPWKTVECVLDLRPGGVFSTTMESPEGERFPNAGCILEVVPECRLTWTSVMGADFRPIAPANGADDLPFTATITMEPTATGGTRYRAVARHADERGAARHAEMGFQEGWGTVFDQLVALIRSGAVQA